MSRRQKFLSQLLAAQSNQNLDFDALCLLLESLGFQQRVRGSHHLFGRLGVEELINLQPAPGNVVKPYQARQVRAILLKYQTLLGLDAE